jgi:predicted RecA/RadA family phage recombinase
MRNFIQPGHTLTLPAPADVLSGQGVVVGAIFGVANGDAATGEPMDLSVLGVYRLPKTAAALAVGDAVSWTDGAVSVAGELLIGVVVEAAAAADPTVAVRLNGAFG